MFSLSTTTPSRNTGSALLVAAAAWVGVPKWMLPIERMSHTGGGGSGRCGGRSALVPSRWATEHPPVGESVSDGCHAQHGGFVNLDHEFDTPQGSNGRSCAPCYLVKSGWSIRPSDVELKFRATQGTDPILNLLDADRPTANVSTPEARFRSYSMLLKGLFRRGGNVPALTEICDGNSRDIHSSRAS